MRTTPAGQLVWCRTRLQVICLDPTSSLNLLFVEMFYTAASGGRPYAEPRGHVLPSPAPREKAKRSIVGVRFKIGGSKLPEKVKAILL